jgi:hypothetical protein
MLASGVLVLLLGFPLIQLLDLTSAQWASEVGDVKDPDKIPRSSAMPRVTTDTDRSVPAWPTRCVSPDSSAASGRTTPREGGRADDTAGGALSGASGPVEWTAAGAALTRAFWLLALGHAGSVAVVAAVNVHLVVFLTENLAYSLPRPPWSSHSSRPRPWVDMW